MEFKVRNEKRVRENNIIWSLYNKEHLFYFDTYQDLMFFVKENNLVVVEIADHISKVLEKEKK
ncbi:MAG: hypothetical protein LBC44_03110 [Mycoplasmataceae bacterium]|jgi:hypothetical protein|nr:hypothetical protein [Mycoplasmataceae bacterium]